MASTISSEAPSTPKTNRKKHVRFCAPDDMELPAAQSNMAADGLLLHVRGHGQLCIRSACEDRKQDGVDIDIRVNIRSDTVPITLFLPHEETESKLEITGDGDIQFAVKKSSDVKKNSKQKSTELYKSELNDLNKEFMVVETGQNNEFKKSHRRNNSDFLQISGKDENSDNEGTDSKTSTQDDNDRTTNNAHSLTDICQRNSAVDKNKQTGLVTYDDCSNCNINDKPDNFFDNEKADGPTDESKSAGQAEGTVRFNSSEQSKTSTLSRSFSFSKTLPNIETNSSSLCESIRRSFTYLLDVLDLQDLCDHLYEHYVIDISLYQTLFEMCFAKNQCKNARRSLLMHLSTRSVQKDKLIDALYGSALYQLIPCFYPDIKI